MTRPTVSGSGALALSVRVRGPLVEVADTPSKLRYGYDLSAVPESTKLVPAGSTWTSTSTWIVVHRVNAAGALLVASQWGIGRGVPGLANVPSSSRSFLWSLTNFR